MADASNLGMGGAKAPAGQEYGPQGTLQPITSAALAPTAPISYSSPNPTPIPSVSGLDSSLATPPLTPTGPEGQATDLTTRLQALNDSLVGKSADQTAANTAAGVDTLTKQQTDLSTQLAQIKNEAAAIPQQLQLDATGRGITAAGLAPLQTARLRANSIAALGVSSLLDSTKGLLSSAQNKANQAVAAKYDPIQAQIDAATKNLNLVLNSPAYSLAEKNRAQAQLDIQNQKAATLAKQKADSATIMSWAAAAIANGATPLQAQQIMQIAQSDTPDLNKAFSLYAPYAKDPNATQKAINELQAQRDTHITSQANLGLIAANTVKAKAETQKALQDANGTGTQDPTVVSGWVTAIKNGSAKLADITTNPGLKSAVAVALGQSGSAQDTLVQTTKDSLAELQKMVDTNHGFTAAVGLPGFTSNPLGALTFGAFGSPIPGSQAADFISKYKQVVNDVVLPNLTILHGLGRVTDREFQALQNSITSLNTNTSESQFKSELADISDRINKLSDAPAANIGDTVNSAAGLQDGTTGTSGGVNYVVKNGQWVKQ